MTRDELRDLLIVVLFWALVAGALGLSWFKTNLPKPLPVEGRIFEPPVVILPAIPPAHIKATAYCTCSICCGRWSDGFTAVGKPPREGWTVASDWTVFPPRTCVKIQGLGVRRVQDSGSAIKGDRIDVFIAAHDRAREFGVKVLGIEPWPC